MAVAYSRRPTRRPTTVWVVVVVVVLVAGAWAVVTANLTTRWGAEPVAVFVGDSYTGGSDQGGNGDANYTHILGQEFGWTTVNTAVGGTGYVVAPDGASPFAGQLPEVERLPSPSLIVVEGSRNDVGAPPARVAAAADQLYTQLRSADPDAKIVVVGPIVPATGTPGPDVVAVRDAVRGAALRAHLPFIDPIAEQWLPPDLIGSDSVHPTDAGHRRIANILGADLQALGVT